MRNPTQKATFWKYFVNYVLEKKSTKIKNQIWNEKNLIFFSHIAQLYWKEQPEFLLWHLYSDALNKITQQYSWISFTSQNGLVKAQT